MSILLLKSYRGPVGFIVITAMTVEMFNSGGLCWSGLRFNTNGSIDEIGPGGATFTPINAGEYWSEEPQSGIGDDYDIRTVSTSGTWASPPATDNNWIDLSVPRTWRHQVLAKDSPADVTVQSTFEFRLTGSGSALDSALGSCRSQN